jgi:hypothetical protein
MAFSSGNVNEKAFLCDIPRDDGVGKDSLNGLLSLWGVTPSNKDVVS